jgi:hypothetical protein
MANLHISPIGEFVGFINVNEADTKYNEDGVYKSQLALSGKPAEDMKAKIDGGAKAHLAEHTDEMKPGEAKKWGLYVPYEDEEDDDGNPTGRTIFHFKQNAKIKTKAGDIKDISIEIRDAADKVISAKVFAGSEGRIMFSMRGIEMSSAKQAGVRLDFYKVQVTKLSKGGTNKGFGAVEDGYVADAEDAGFGGSDCEGDY